MTSQGYGLLPDAPPVDPVDSASEEVEVGEAHYGSENTEKPPSPYGSERSARSEHSVRSELLPRRGGVSTSSQLELLWRTSLEPAFLRSKASRRQLWRILLPLLALGLAALNFIAGTGLAALLSHEIDESSVSLAHRRLSCFSDAAMLTSMIVASRLPTYALWSDAIIMTIMGIYGVSCGLLERPEAILRVVTTAALCADFYRVLVVLTFVSSGIHICAIGGFLLLSAATLPLMGARHELPRLLVGLVAVILAAVSYMQPFQVFKELREATEATEAAQEKASRSVKSTGMQTDSGENEFYSLGNCSTEAPTSDPQVVIPEEDDVVPLLPNLPSGCPAHLSTAAKAALRSRLAREKEVREREGKDKEPTSQETPEDEGADVEAQVSLVSDQSASLQPVSFQPSSGTRATSSLRYSASSRGSRLSRMSPWSNSSDPANMQAYLSGRRPKTMVDCGAQTEMANLNAMLCRRCMRPPSLPASVIDKSSARSSRTSSRQASMRSSARSAMRMLGQLTRRSKSRDTDDTLGAIDGYDDAVPVVSSFQVTNKLSVSISLQWAMKHWNLPRIVGSCCPWHTALLVAHTALENLETDECDPLWSSLTDWQCAECTCLNHAEVQRCDMCFESKPSLPSSGGSSDQASTFGNSLDAQSVPSSTQQSLLRAMNCLPDGGESVRPMWSGSSAVFSRHGTTSTTSPSGQTGEVTSSQQTPPSVQHGEGTSNAQAAPEVTSSPQARNMP